MNEPRLDEYDEDEWRDIVRAARPDWSEEEIAEAWARFVEAKRMKGMH